MKTFAPKALIVALFATTAFPAVAAFNVYKNGDISLDINGEINLYAKNVNQKFEYVPSGKKDLDDLYSKYKNNNYIEERTDRRTRLGQDDGASYTEIRGSQQLNNDYRVTGTVGFGYYDSATGAYLSNANLAVDKKGLGSVSVGRQYLHAGYVTRTNTYTPLETFAEKSIRVDYTAKPGLHLSGYYNPPSSADLRYSSPSEVKGYGASASYVYPLINDSNVRFAAGYSYSKANPDTNNKLLSNKTPIVTKGIAGSLEYRTPKLVAALDVGRLKEDLDGSIKDDASTNYVGAKVSYEATPRLVLSLGYGKKDSKRSNKSNITAKDLFGNKNSKSYGKDNIIKAYENYLVDTKTSQRAYVRADYYLRDNVRLYGRIDQEKVKTTLSGKELGKYDSSDSRIGLSFVF